MRAGPLLVAVCGVAGLAKASCLGADVAVRDYLERHCFECHDGATRKGGLDLESLALDVGLDARFSTWEKVHDRIADGEMPPRTRSDRPSAEESAIALKWLDDRLHEADRSRVGRVGRSLLRRMTAQEYENALKDLLFLPGLRIKHLLPEDERRHGYNKVAQALDLSSVHLNQLMDAADMALTAAIATQSVPPPRMQKRFGATSGSETWNWVARGDAVLLKDKAFDPLVPLPGADQDLWGAKGSEAVKDRSRQLGTRLREYDGSIGYFTGPIEPTFSLSLQFSPVHAGNYRVRTSAWGFWWDRGEVEPPHQNESYMLSVWLPSDGPRFIHSPSRRLGMFDVPSLQSRVHEFTGWFDVNEELLFEIGTPTGYERNTGRWASQSPGSCAAHTGPGIALDWFEVEGPLFDQWPPKSHVALFEGLPIRAVTDGAGVMLPKREPVRQRSSMPNTRPTNVEVQKEVALRPVESVFSERPEVDATRLLRGFLERAFRRSITEEELGGYVGIVTREMGRRACFEDAMKEAYKAALCSTDFLYLGDDRQRDAESPSMRLPDRVLADRLAFWLWNSIPDAELVRLAEEGVLHRPEILMEQVDRLLGDERSDRFIVDFTDQWLDLRKIDATQPDTRVYPEAREHLKHSMLAETRAYLRELISKDLSVTHLVRSDFAMLNQGLAQHYGISGVVGCAIRRVSLAADLPRGAFLTQASVLKVTANGTTTSPVTRGVWVSERILGKPVPPPPAGVPAIDPDTRGAKTIREQLEKHRADAHCAGCHSKIDPAGFALERFDVIGGYRERYRSLSVGDTLVRFGFASGFDPRVRLHQAVDASGQLSSGEPFHDISGFQSLVLRQPEVLAENMVRQLVMYATGAEAHYSDRREVARIVEASRGKGFGVRSLIEAIVLSELFLMK